MCRRERRGEERRGWRKRGGGREEGMEGWGGVEEGVGDGRGRGRRRVYVCVWSCEDKKWGVRAEQLGEAAWIRPLTLRLPNSVVS